MLYQVHLIKSHRLFLNNVSIVITWIIGIYFLGIQFCHRVQRVFYRLREKPRLYCRYNTQQCIKNNSLFALVPLGEHTSKFAHLFIEGSSRCPLHFGSLRNFSSDNNVSITAQAKRTTVVFTAFK